MLVIPDYFLIILIGVSFFIGVGIGIFLKKRKKSSYENARYSPKKNPFLNKIHRKISQFKRSVWAVVGVVWLVLLVIIFPFFGLNSLIDSAISLISLVIGLNFSYNLMKIFMRKQVRTEYDIWVIRIKAIIFACVGIFIAIFAAISTYLVDRSGILPMVGPSPLTIYLWSVGFGMIIFAGYMEFVFERTAGILVFGGKQRF
ncbi:MAG: hypothetical protein ACYDDV_09650 [Methanoregula sp.]